MMFQFTDEEIQKTFDTCILSYDPLVLKVFPAKEKKKYILLSKIITVFNPSMVYHELEVNEILKPIYDDFATIRRYLVDYHFLSRTKDGSKYTVRSVSSFLD